MQQLIVTAHTSGFWYKTLYETNFVEPIDQE